jgi:hypothetical protein
MIGKPRQNSWDRKAREYRRESRARVGNRGRTARHDSKDRTVKTGQLGMAVQM